MKNATKAEEQARVTAVIAKLKARLAAIHEQIEAAHRETSRIERAYGENTKVNVTEVDDQMETNAAVQQQKSWLHGRLKMKPSLNMKAIA